MEGIFANGHRHLAPDGDVDVRYVDDAGPIVGTGLIDIVDEGLARAGLSAGLEQLAVEAVERRR
jgi:hypothetical protein